ncbi:MAG TPA: aminotransferase class IV [Gemmatimonadaceae bacterium]|nr:aminotransferase class IV [Gemmatimonadaceae bacterium]
MDLFLNGEIVDEHRAAVPVTDRAFLFGDGVYEVLRASRGVMFEPARHFKRLRSGLDELRIGSAAVDEHDIPGVAAQLLERNGLASGDALVYIQVTRGVAPRVHHFPPVTTPRTVLVSTSAFTPKRAERESGVEVITHPDQRWARCDIKSVNLLPNVLASQAAASRGAYEAVLLRDGVVTEGARSSVFAVVRGELRTHPATERILHGITRAVVLELAREASLPVREEPVTMSELGSASEIFLAGTTADVMPVTSIEGLPVGSGTPGEITRRLGAALDARMAAAFGAAPARA